MNRLIRRFVWSSLLLHLFAYPTQVDAQSVELDRFEVAIDFKEEGYYRSIPFIALNRDLFFITDNFSHRVLEYRFEGNKLEFLRAIGRPGQGPGDLMLPMDISIAADILAVRDESGISFFDLNGVFKNKFQLLSRAETMLFTGKEIYTTTYHAAKPDLIQVYSREGEILKSFQKKKSLYPIRYDIHKGLSPDQLERIVFEGLLISDEQSIYFLSRRFGSVLRYDPDGNRTGNWGLSEMLGNNEKAKAEWNRKMFLEEGYDLEKNKRMIPHNYLFEDAHIVGGRLYLLLENYDLLEKKVKSVIEFAEIDLRTKAVVCTFRADAQAKWESAAAFVFIGDEANPVFLVAVRRPGEDEKLCVFKPRASTR
jgi:hypothetical protein